MDIDTKLIALPTANMLGPLLGRSLQMEEVDINTLKDSNFYQTSGEYKTYKLSDEFTEDQIKYLLDSPTQQITQFGLGYHTDPNSPLFLLSSQSDRIYDHSLNSLHTLIKSSSENSSKTEIQTSEGVDAGIEAIIKGVESSGALGIRALQLAVQFYNFPPEMHKRLSAAFDAVPALNKAFFWENLNRLAEDSPEIEELLKNTTVKKCLGGGSLQTTYEAHFKQPDGTDKAGTLKMKNPNVAARLKDTYSAAKVVLDTVAGKNENPQVQEQARVGSMLIDLSQNWCLADINDSTFEVDDDAFKQTIDKYNQRAGFGAVYAPDRIFTSQKLTSEELVPGKTVNQLLNNPSIDDATKKDLVWTMTEFFLFQMQEPVTLPDGSKKYLIHSDPHVGNIIADLGGEDIKMGIIDRSLFIKMDETEVNLIQKMINGSNISDFAYSTIDYLLNHNKIRGVKKGLITSQVLGKLSQEFTKQFSKGEVNKISLLNTLFMELNKTQGGSFDIPLNLRLMMRNIAASQELTKRYGLNLEEIARTTQFI
jgi:predicted unusual protein kinase regulating ubiquinone biosynthesis (AarF/ABC1/UbiB family)